MYLAGLIADDLQMTKKDIQHWVDKATCNVLCGSTVSWVAAESLHGWCLALEWIESNKENVAVAGWATLKSLLGIKDDADLDLAALKRLLLRVQKGLLKEPNRVRSALNGFVIAVGVYVQPLTDLALQTAQKVGNWDEKNGIVLGDPVKGQFQLIVTADGRANWKPLAAKNLPPALPGEGAFAASGSCLITQGGSDVWFVTGAPRRRGSFISRIKANTGR